MNNPIKCYVCDKDIKVVNVSSIAWSKVAVRGVGLVRHKSCYIGNTTYYAQEIVEIKKERR